MTATLPDRDTARFDVLAWDRRAGFTAAGPVEVEAASSAKSTAASTAQSIADHSMTPTPMTPTSWLDTETPAHLRSDLPCQVEDGDLWFADTPAELEAAKAQCGPCPLRLTCLAGALERREPWGVWGGEILERGTVIARKRPRGRPRKEAA